jgi:hypothetical protein
MATDWITGNRRFLYTQKTDVPVHSMLLERGREAR